MPDPIPVKNKTVAFVSNSAWSVYNFRLDVIRSLLALGYRVLVMAPDDDYSKKLVDEKCSFIPIAFNNKKENPFTDYLFYRSLRRLYRAHAPDFIFHFVAKPNIYGSMAATGENIPSVAVVTGLGYPFAKRNLLFHLIRILYRRALRNVHEVWFLNNEDARVFVDERIVAIRKVKVLPGEGINVHYFSRANRALLNVTKIEAGAAHFNFLMATRLLKSKGVSFFADAARIVKKKFPNARFTLIGFFETDHPDSVSPHDIERWQSEGILQYQGFADDVRPFLAVADCFVFPSFYNEGVPRCLMEAASMELPIITSLSRGCKEVVTHDVNGYLVNVQDPFDLADKMERLMKLPEEYRARMGKNGREMVEKKFGIAKIVQEYTNTLISAFETNHGSNS